MSRSVTCYAKGGKIKQRLISEAFALGSGGVVAYDATSLEPGPAAFYGAWDATANLYQQATTDGRDWYYIDNAYFGHGRYFRITRKAEQHSGIGKGAPERWKALRLTIEPWRDSPDGHVLVTLQSQVFFEVRRESRQDWLDGVLDTLRCTDRKIVIRDKPKRPDDGGFYDALDGCWALVTRSSNTAVLALLRGIPVFCTHPCAASVMGLDDLKLIEIPRRPENRLSWAECLAGNQWTLDEIRDGIAWKALGNS